MDPIIYVERFLVDEASGFATLVFRLSTAANAATSVRVSTSSGTADSGWDYTNYNSILNFARGETVRTVQIPLISDTTVEGIEHFWVNLSSPVGLVIDQPAILVSIVDNDQGDRAPIVSVEDVTVDESDGFARFNIILDRVSNVPVTVTYRTVNESATAGSDYTARTGSVTFAAGQTARTISVAIANDTAAERAETFAFELTGISGVTGAQLGARRATGTIGLSDGTSAGTPFVTVDPITVSEGNTDGVVDVVIRLSAPSTVRTSVRLSTSSGTADSGWDYASYNSTLTFAPGETVKIVQIPILNDATVEGIEQFWVNLSSPTGLVIDQPSSLASIVDNDRGDRAPVASVEDVTVDESDGFARFVINLDRASNVPVTVSYRTVNNSATAGSDYTAKTGSVTFAAGQTSQTILVAIANDTAAERAETFAFELTGISGVTGAQLGARSATGTIGLSDGSSAGTPFVTVDPVTVSEGDTDGVVDVVIRLSAPSATLTSVRVSTSGGTADSGWDYASYNSTLTFAPGETVKIVQIPILNDATVEGIEQFWINLSSPTGLVIGQPSTTISIVDNDRGDRAPVVSVENVTVDESDGFARFVINLDRSSNSVVTINYETVAGTAGAADFTARTGSVIFNPGETSATVAVAITDDTTSEAAESFRLRLTGISGATNAAVSDGEATATISRSDGATSGVPTLTVSDVSVSESAQFASFQLFLNAPSTTLTSVRASTSGGTADSGWDYASYNEVLTFAPGETVKTVQIPILNDTTVEAAETFTLNLSSPSGLVLARTSATGTILNDDGSQVQVSAVSPQKAEGQSGTNVFTFFVDRSGDLSTAQSVRWAVAAESSGLSAADFQGGVLPSGTVSFAANETRKTVSVGVVGDLASEANEAFLVRLSAPSSGLIVTNASARSVILNEDTTSVITGTAAGETLTGGASTDVINGLGGADILLGLAGNDTLNGGAGADRLTGGAGADLLTGGTEADTFIFTALSDSTVALAGRDTILDFSRAQGDRISLSAIDANTGLAGDQAFVLATEDFTGVPGQISVARWGTRSTVSLDVNGDGVADSAFQVVSATALAATDFIL